MVRTLLLVGLCAVGVLAAENATAAGMVDQVPPAAAAPPPATPSGPSLFGTLGAGLDSLIFGWVPKVPGLTPAPSPAPAPAPAPAPQATSSSWSGLLGGTASSWRKPAPAAPASSFSGGAMAAGANMLTGLLTGISTGVGTLLQGIAANAGGLDLAGDAAEESWYEKLRGSRGGGGSLEGLVGPPIAPSIEAEPYVPGPTIDNRSLWQPKVGSPFQIILASPVQIGPLVDTSTRDTTSKGGASMGLKVPLLPDRVDIFDVDLWDNPTDTVERMHAAGKKVICYFSAGTSEDWRPDFNQFSATDMGANLPLWRGERWLDVRSKTVWNVMQKRIELASKRGCDAIDPDNVGTCVSFVNSCDDD
jgi:hypothetical protein